MTPAAAHMMSMSNQVRKSHTGEPGNGGEFGTHRRANDDVRLGSNDEPDGTMPSELIDANYLGIPLHNLGLDVVPAPPGIKFESVYEPGGYDEIERSNDGMTVFRRGGRIHRQDGPAVFHPDGEVVFALDDVEITPPDRGTGEDLGLQLVSADGGVQRWASAGRGPWECIVSPGNRVFLHDGDLHRDGGPAIVSMLGEDWYQHGTKVASPIPAPPMAYVVNANAVVQYTTLIGSKYDETLRARDIARALRGDFEYAKRCGVLPFGADVTVRTDARYQSVNVSVNGCHGGGDRRVRDQMQSIADAYTKREFEDQTDYDQRNVYTSVVFRSRSAGLL